jgi:pimeloyl-ACP methyl ester carboxylesterase
MEEKVFYNSIDNIKLCGLLSRVNDDKRIVLLCHGLKSNKKSDSFNSFVDSLQSKRINSFRFDFRGHGESGGNDYEMTPTKEVCDLESTLNYLEELGFNEIIILGSSFGGSIISLLDYKNYSCVKGLICWYAALDYFAPMEGGHFFSKEHKDIADKIGWFESVSKKSGKVFKLGKKLFEEVYEIVPYKKLITVELPILFVHGLIDKMVPYELSVNVSKMCKNSRLELIENGDHSFTNGTKALCKAIEVSIDFIEEIFKLY